MRTWTAALACLVLVGRAGEAWSEPPIPEMRETLVVRTSQGRADYLDGKLIGETIRDLRRQSPTFRDLLAVLAQSRVIAMFSPSSDVNHVSGLIGRTRFHAGEQHVVALIEVYIDRRNVWTHREAVAHELAHVAEMGCLGDLHSQADIASAMQQYTGKKPSLGPTIANETGFALAIGRAVLKETLDGPARSSQFRSIAQRFRLPGCPARLPGDQAVLAEQRAR